MMELLIIIFIGIVLIVISIHTLWKIKQVKNKGIKTEGIVYDIVDSQTFSLKYKTPIIRFTDLQNQWITEQSNVGVYWGRHKKGDAVTIIYEKENPKNFILDNSTNNLIVYLLLVGGILMTLIATIIISFGIKF